MADSSSRALLTPAGSYTKAQSAWKGTQSTYKIPLLIFSFLVLLIVCIAASVIVLLISDEDPVGEWTVRPAVLLSIITGVYIVALGGLFTAGVAVTWWRSLSNVTTLKELHFIYAGASPTALVPALLAGNHASKVAVAALIVFAAKLAVGPVLQRATRPEAHMSMEDVGLNVDLASQIPDGWFGTWGSLSDDAFLVARNTFLGSNTTTKDTEGYLCPMNGTCEANVTAAGLNFDFQSGSDTIDLLDPESKNSTLFSIEFNMNYDSDFPILFLDTSFVSEVTKDCVATLTKETYAMIPATVVYPVSVHEKILMPDIERFIENPYIVSNSSSTADEETEESNAPRGPLKGIQGGLSGLYHSQIVLSELQNGKALRYAPTAGTSALWAGVWRRRINNSTDYPDSVIENCPLLWDSPTKDVLGNILDYMFRVSNLVATQDQKDDNKQTVTAIHIGQKFQYVTDFRWLAASVAVMVIGAVTALSLIWGWWELDRHVTLSPLETGKAFGSPIFSTAGPEQEAHYIVKQVGHERVAHDGDELVWNGNIYATGAGGSFRGTPGRYVEETPMGEVSGGSSTHSSLRGRGHRRGMSSVSDTNSSQGRPSFEHSLGVTTRRPYEDEEEMDIGQYGRPRASSYGSDTTPLMPMPLNINGAGRSPTLPPIPRMGSIRMENGGPAVGRSRRRSRSALDVPGRPRRPLSKIDESRSPTR